MTKPKAETRVSTPTKAATLPEVAAYVSPSELCQQQTRALASDAFTALAAHGY